MEAANLTTMMTDDKTETSKSYDTIKLGIDKTTPKREEIARQLVEHAEEITRVYAKEGLPCTVLPCGALNRPLATITGQVTIRSPSC